MAWVVVVVVVAASFEATLPGAAGMAELAGMVELARIRTKRNVLSRRKTRRPQ